MYGWSMLISANIAMLPTYHISKIVNISGNTCPKKPHYCSTLSVQKLKLLLCLWLKKIVCPVPHSAQPSNFIKYCVIHRLLRIRPNKSLYDLTFNHMFFRGNQMTACEQIRVCAVVVNCFNYLGLHIIWCFTVCHRSEMMIHQGLWWVAHYAMPSS